MFFSNEFLLLIFLTTENRKFFKDMFVLEHLNASLQF